MAINYLNSVDLNKNYIDNAAIQNLAVEPTADTPGQIYFNTTSQALKVTVQTGTSPDTFAWEEVGSDSVVAGTGIVITPGTGAQAGNSVITNSGLITLGVVAGSQNWTIANGVNTTTTFASASANEITIDSPGAGTVRIGLPADVTISNDLTVSNDINVDGEAAVSGSSEFTGLVTASAGVAITTGTLSAGASTTIDLGANRVTNIADPTTAQDAATKAYVDAATVGGLIYQGGYDASTNTPALDTAVTISGVGSGSGPFQGTVATTGGSGTGMTVYVETNAAGALVVAAVVNGGTSYAVGDIVQVVITGHTGQSVAVGSVPIANIEVGWTYTVTTAGYFYNELVAPGDVLIAEFDAPTEQDAWTKVQNNIDLASSFQIGIGNVVAGASATVTAPYTNGTATLDVVDSTANQKGAVIVAGGTGISVAYASGTATVTNTETNADNSFSGTIGDGSLTSLPITSATHGLGTDSSSFMVQLVQVSDGATVYSDVVRGASGLVTVNFAAAPATNAIRVLIQKIG